MKNKWTLLAFLCGIFFIYTVDRSLLGILALPIQRETGISDTTFGILNAAIFWTYAAVVPFAGIIADRANRGRLIGLAAFAWSVMMIASGFANGFWSLLILVSFAITAPQTFYGPAANALIATHHRATRTIALSVHQAAFYTGWFISGAAVAACLAIFQTWRAVYFVFGALGILVSLAFLFVFGREKSAAVAREVKPKLRVVDSLRAFFCCPTALLLAVGYVAVVFVSFGYSAWGPKFVALKFNLSPEKAGTAVMFWHYAAAFAAIVVAGGVTDFFIRRWPRFRLALQSIVLLLASPMLAIFGLGSSLVFVFAAAATFGLMRGLFESNAFAALFDVIPEAHRSAAVGFMNVLAGTLGSLSPIILGMLSDKKGLHGFEIGFTILGVALVGASLALAAALFFTFRHDYIHEKN